MEDWDLQAIVKGSCRSSPNSRILMEDHPNYFYSFWSELDDDHEFSNSNSNSNSSTYAVNYDPHHHQIISSSQDHDHFEEFGRLINYNPVLHPNYINSGSSISDHLLLREFKKEPEKLHHNKQITAAKQKQSKKSRENRIVKEVKADDICSDSWGWRKYGQKPIKGSPYPRSYYRCSSSKGCSARKQVERSLSDPDIFLVTYTAEHNHAEPTRRNALAGTTRKKFPTTTPSENPSGFHHNMLIQQHHYLSPKNSVALSIIEDQDHDHQQPMMEEEEEEGVMPFEFSNEDLFTGLEDLLFGY